MVVRQERLEVTVQRRFVEYDHVVNKQATVLLSGHTGGIISPDQIVEGQTVFLAKPFTPAQLLAKIGQLLQDATPTRHSS